MKNLEDTFTKTANRFPEIADEAARAMTQVRLVAEQIQAGRLPDRATETMNQANASLSELTKQLKALNAGELSSEADKNLKEFNGVLVRTNALLTRLDGEQGLFHNAERSADAIGEVARGARSFGPELELTLREVRAAAHSIKRLADDLDRDPDMLLKGRAQKAKPMSLQWTPVRRALAIACCALPMGCALTSKADVVSPRYFSPEPAAGTRSPKATDKLELRLGQVSSASHLDERIAYRVGGAEMGFYDDRRWTENPEAYLRRALERDLFEERGLSRIVTGGTPILDIELTAFEELRGQADASARRRHVQPAR